eukprot:11439884-Heterocapsa_arctica.AAC.1
MAVVAHVSKSLCRNISPDWVPEEFPDTFQDQKGRSDGPADFLDVVYDLSPWVIKTITQSRSAERLTRESRSDDVRALRANKIGRQCLRLGPR